MLIRLLYASRASQPVTPELIESILTQARAHNPEHGITGILCHGAGVFMQALEGGRDEINALYNRIARDTRHSKVVVLQYEEISERLFAGWTMGQVNLSKINPSLLLKYSAKPVLDPYAVSGRASMALLQEFIATASIGCRN